MKYGITLPYNIPLQVVETARVAEQAGWDGLFLGDAIWCTDPMIALTGAAMVTSRIRLGTMIIPAPIRSPWKVASESVALDLLSNGRLTLGLGMGAVWMGWDSFPDAVTGTKARAEMLGEMIDLLTLFYMGKPFDYNGKHYRALLSIMGEQHYPPKPIQQPRIPLWIVGAWPRKASMERALKGDGLLPQKLNPDAKGSSEPMDFSKFAELTPADLRDIKAYVSDHRAAGTPYDYVIEGQTRELSTAQAQDKIGAWQESGATWWIESMYNLTHDQILDRLHQGPPRVD
jgi:alkanesulfonate monooxygenase SsuD/methylene tetrahydromethanopterin reductase-like flavin-dependent oxidoreductase (luciferase family)